MIGCAVISRILGTIIVIDETDNLAAFLFFDAHLINLCVYCRMKSRVNLTIEDSLLKSTKLYAQKHGTSVSVLVEEYFRNITKPARKTTIIDLVQQLDPPVIDPAVDLKDLFYQETGKKYGF
jgi:hypothetical protein